jgi:hypothetical protein
MPTHTATRGIQSVIGPARLWLVSLLAVAMVAATSGLAYAGSLPAIAQQAARSTMARVGIEVPGPNQRASPAPVHPNDSRGWHVSEVPRTTTTTERDEGEEGSAVPSSNSPGRQDHHVRDATADQADPRSASEEPPNAGGTGTANEASDGPSKAGTTTADEASNGHSAAGSGNAGDHPQKPDDRGHRAGDHPQRPDDRGRPAGDHRPTRP